MRFLIRKDRVDRRRKIHRTCDVRTVFLERFYVLFIAVYEFDRKTVFGEISSEYGAERSGSVYCTFHNVTSCTIPYPPGNCFQVESTTVRPYFDVLMLCSLADDTEHHLFRPFLGVQDIQRLIDSRDAAGVGNHLEAELVI